MWCFSEVLKSCCNFNKPPDVTASVLKLQIFSQDITRRLKLEFYDAGRLLGLKTNRCSRKTNPPLHRRIPNQLLSPAGVFSPARPDVISLPAADINSTFSRPASQDGSVAPYEEHACRFTSIATSSSKLVAVTRCVHRRRKLLLLLCGEEEAPRWPIYRPDLDADVTQQSGTVCAAAALTGVYGTAADCCIEVRSHLPRLEVFSLRDRGK